MGFWDENTFWEDFFETFIQPILFVLMVIVQAAVVLGILYFIAWLFNIK